jgi:hypothetical protein
VQLQGLLHILVEAQRRLSARARPDSRTRRSSLISVNGKPAVFVRLPRSRPLARQVQVSAWFRALSIDAKDQIKRLVSATCLARLTVPSVSEIVRLAASSLLMVSRADLTIIGWPLGPTAMA